MMDSATRITIFCLWISLISFSCSGNKNKKVIAEKFQENVINPITTASSSKKDTLPQKNNSDSLRAERNERIAELIKEIRTVEVLEITKTNKRIASNGEDFGTMCDKWHLDKNVIEKIIKASKPISGEAHHYLYDVMPCEFEGKVIVNKQTFSFSVNAGSYLYLSNADTSFLFGCTEKKLEKYFLSKVWDGKE